MQPATLGDILPNQAKQEIKDENPADQYFCGVCGDKAGKHSYYGGQVCASCRAFFRRSVQSKYYELFVCKKSESCEVTPKNRKGCQFCRFKKCLGCGMKVSWVLSDDERNRRFNKFNKVKSMKSLDRFSGRDIKMNEPYMAFTIEESKLLEEINSRFSKHKESWLFNMITHNQSAFANFVEAAFEIRPLKYSAWRSVEDMFEIYFVKIVIPQFKEVETLPFYDKSLILSGDNPRVAHAFKASLCMFGSFDDDKVAAACNPGDDKQGEEAGNLGPECPLSRQFKDIAENKKLMETLGLEDKLANLNINDQVIRLPRYQTLFPDKWANNREVEERHRQIYRKILHWPTIDNKFDGPLVLIMTMILIFNPDFSAIVHREKVEKLQLKYILLLQRYLKSKMEPADANKKFLDAMLLISYTKEMWDLQKLHVSD